MKIAIIPCQNGLGHAVRSFFLFKELKKKKINVKFFYNKKSKNIFSNYSTHLNCETKLINFKNGNYLKKNYKKNLFKKYDFVYIDNLYEKIIKLDKKAIIFANFFWFNLYNIKKNFYKSIINKKKNIHKIFTNYLFFHRDSFRDIKKFYKVGFFGKFSNEKFKKRNNILISLGTADFYNEKNLINEIINNLPIIKAGKIYLDLKIFYKISNIKNNILLSKYNKNMYKDLAVAIVKPGFSTLENCLRNGVTPISFFKNLNSEFHHNSRIIKKKQIGICFK